ncbi:transposase, partial [Motilimonas sp. 1_MG-2023]|uniref:IS66 family transposase n=1 Tax=Motilimonas sp. 1_MG-2023 TaxID=3062672 RepID=UPI0026E286F4
VRQADVIFADETSHQRDNESRWMWLITCDDAACFNTHYSRGKLAAKKLLGEQVNGFVVTDQYAGYHWLEDTQRQLCWAHILRNVTQIAEYSGGGYTAKVGQQLVLRIEAIFRTQHRFEDGYITDAVYRRRMKRLRLSWQKQLGLGLEIPASRYQ